MDRLEPFGAKPSSVPAPFGFLRNGRAHSFHPTPLLHLAAARDHVCPVACLLVPLGWALLVVSRRQRIRPCWSVCHAGVLLADPPLLSEVGSVGADASVHRGLVPAHDLVVRPAILAWETIGMERPRLCEELRGRGQQTEFRIQEGFKNSVSCLLSSNRFRLASIRVDQRTVQESARR